MDADERKLAIFLLGPWVRHTTIIASLVNSFTAHRLISGPPYTRRPIQSGKRNSSFNQCLTRRA
jgi:hypothetical protein